MSIYIYILEYAVFLLTLSLFDTLIISVCQDRASKNKYLIRPNIGNEHRSMPPGIQISSEFGNLHRCDSEDHRYGKKSIKPLLKIMEKFFDLREKLCFRYIN